MNIALWAAGLPFLGLTFGGGDNPRVVNAAGVNHRFVTSFATSENPISEGGVWINGKAAGLDWADVRMTPGMAFGAALPTRYADPTAVLSGIWGSDQWAQGTVRVKTAFTACCREIELRLRTRIEAHSITGYEVLCSVVRSSPYLSIVRWNGPLNDFTEIGRIDRGCSNGDVLKAGIQGSTITVWKNGTQTLRVSDGKYTTGSPGLGFYNHSTDLWSNLGFRGWDQFGFSRFSATDDDADP